MKSYLQTGCLILGILCFVYYTWIVLYAGFRTSLSWLWVIGGAFFLVLRRLLACAGRGSGTAALCAARALLLLLAAGLAVLVLLGSRVVAGMFTDPAPGLGCVIVLGAQVRGTEPSRALRRRLDRAVSYARENPQTVFILSGGQGPDEEISEAECMRRYMERRGIPAQRLLLEDRSTSTEENLLFSAALLDREHDSVGVLTNSFHVCRAMMLAKRQGYLHVSGIPASSDPGMQPHNVLREVCCLLADAVLRYCLLRAQ